jgi:hypothetical protein
MSEGCVFCDQSWMREAEIFIETPHCIFASTRDPDIRARAKLAEGVLPGSGAIVPIAHRTSVFELTPAEFCLHESLSTSAIIAHTLPAIACPRAPRSSATATTPNQLRSRLP